MKQIDLSSNSSLSDIKKVSSAFSGVFSIIMIFMITFFSGFGALGTAIFYLQESSFFRTAIEAEALVQDVRERRRQTERIENNRRTVTTTISYSALIDFSDSSGVDRSAVLSLGEETPFQVGDHITIFYQPDNPTSVRRADMSGNVSNLKLVSQVFGTVFLGSFVILVLMHKRRRNISDLRTP